MTGKKQIKFSTRFLRLILLQKRIYCANIVGDFSADIFLGEQEMIIKGLQKLTLLDYPGKCACTVFTFGCNLRCPFCHNASLVIKKQGDDGIITEEDFFKFLDGRKGLLDGVAITGGEPLLQPDLRDFIIKIKEKGFFVKLDTNGTSPEKLKALIDENLLDYVAMDIKNSFQKYPQTVGITCFDVTPVKESIKILLEDKVDYEFRTTVCKELFNLEDFDEIAKAINGAKRYFLQAFIDSGDILNGAFTAPEKACMNTYSNRLEKTLHNVRIRGI